MINTENQQWPLEWGQSETVDGFNFDLGVHLKGGEYFFAPSISCSDLIFLINQLFLILHLQTNL
ncbi:MAG TPA: hypothetical protein VK184_19155 [Nostocaceae cyanobacterium]|nr:hypothetical protein [Nostocaceae cyanobacterium]